uniref:Uncharacterized protein n=1 Tax=Cacopsylla melanoneura TaxID=428564 RepID=A0A8D9DUB7_9HEMI
MTWTGDTYHGNERKKRVCFLTGESGETEMMTQRWICVSCDACVHDGVGVASLLPETVNGLHVSALICVWICDGIVDGKNSRWTHSRTFLSYGVSYDECVCHHPSHLSTCSYSKLGSLACDRTWNEISGYQMMRKQSIVIIVKSVRQRFCYGLKFCSVYTFTGLSRLDPYCDNFTVEISI